MSGGGVFDGKGQMAWQKNNCKEKYSFKTLPIVRFQSQQLAFKFHYIFVDIYRHYNFKNFNHQEILIQALIPLMILRILSYY